MESDIKGDIAIPIGLERVEWDRVAKLVVRKIHDLKTNGTLADASEEDIFHDVMVKFLGSADHLGWDPKKMRKELTLEEGLANFLISVADYKMRDLNRSPDRRKRAPGHLDDRPESRGGDSDLPFPINVLTTNSHTAEHDLMNSEFRRYLVSLVPGDRIAIGIINAAVRTTGSGKVDQELAYLVFGDKAATREIVNAKKRIRRAVMKDERYLYLLWMTKVKTMTGQQGRTPSPTL